MVKRLSLLLLLMGILLLLTISVTAENRKCNKFPKLPACRKKQNKGRGSQDKKVEVDVSTYNNGSGGTALGDVTAPMMLAILINLHIFVKSIRTLLVNLFINWSFLFSL